MADNLELTRAPDRDQELCNRLITVHIRQHGLPVRCAVGIEGFVVWTCVKLGGWWVNSTNVQNVDMMKNRWRLLMTHW